VIRKSTKIFKKIISFSSNRCFTCSKNWC